MRRICIAIAFFSIMLPQVIYGQESGDIAAVVTKIEGKLRVATKGSDQWLYAQAGDFLYEGDRLKTDARSLATITFVNGIEVKLNKNTVFAINVTEISDRGKGNAVKLSVGQVWSRILKAGTQFDIETPAATVAIRGSEGDTRVRKNGRTRFILYYGRAYVENEFGKVIMKPGTKTSIAIGAAPAEPQTIGDADREEWQERISSKPRLKLEIEKPDVVVGYPVRLKVFAIDAQGNIDRDVRKKVRITTSNEGAAFSTLRSGKDRKKVITVTLTRGTEDLWIYPLKAGSTVITAQADGLDTGMGRLFAFQPSKKNLELELETEDGKRKTLKLKFRR